jgi:predicted O-linked N-acetylglucosamine transferase (SPINDLY family)
MDFQAIYIFVNEAFFNKNTPTVHDVNIIIEFFKKHVLVNYNISFYGDQFKEICQKILEIKCFCKEIFELYDVVLSSLIIHHQCKDQTSMTEYFTKFINNRILYHQDNFQEKDKIGIETLRQMTNLFIPLVSINTQEIIESRYKFQKACLWLNNNDWKDSILLQPYDTLPFWFVQPAFGLTYHDNNNNPLLTLYSEFYRNLLLLRYPNLIQSNNTLTTHKNKKRIGCIGRTFCNHAIGRITLGLIEQLGKTYSDDFDIIVYTHQCDEYEQSINYRMRNAVSESHIISLNNIEETIQKLRNDKLDIILFPDAFMDIYIYLIAHYRSAPIQITTWGHPDTSGIDTIDYYISSEYFEKQTDNLYNEKLICMKSLSFYYYPLQKTYFFDPIQMFKDVPQNILREQLGLPQNAHIYGITSSMYKMQPTFDAIINTILVHDENAYIVLIHGVYTDLYQKVMKRLSTTTNNFDRIVTVPYQTELYGYEKLLLSFDVILDTHPFGGCISTFDAFSCNKCVITLPCNKLYGRFTQGMYTKMGMTELIVKDQDKYVELALKIATYPTLRRELEHKIGLNKHLLYEDKESIDEWANFLKNVATN